MESDRDALADSDPNNCPADDAGPRQV